MNKWAVLASRSLFLAIPTALVALAAWGSGSVWPALFGLAAGIVLIAVVPELFEE